MFEIYENRLIRRYDAETLWIEPWGENSLRVRATAEFQMPEEAWALLPQDTVNCRITIDENGASIINGKMKAVVDRSGKIRFYNQKEELLLEEFIRDMDQKDFSSHMRIRGRELKGNVGGAFQAKLRFESDPEEKLFGMGQYQQGTFNLKGTHLELVQRNAQCSVPFVLSSKGYGFLWNNPAVGEVAFGTNITQWKAEATHQIDYWITAGDAPNEIVEQYVKVTGLPPMMPESAMGFWQCKLRYRTQEELLNVAREYKKRNLPLSVIVIDFYHWTKFGEWKFDPESWPDPDAMMEELKAMGIDVAVSVWPSVQYDSENFNEMLEKGYLTRTDSGVRISMQSTSWTIFFDATNEKAREYVWQKCKKSYFDKGIRYFWLDAAEPQYASYQNYGAEPYRYQIGPHLTVGNMYPQLFAKGFYDGLKAEGEEHILSLVRCAWAGSQRYGALVWSGDIHSSFRSMRWQIVAGLHMGIAGIGWWTTDIGGFDWGNIHDEKFQELLVRWFQWGAFSPVMRLHGDRQPHETESESGLTSSTGAENEVWSFGEANYPILVNYLHLREAMRPYIRRLMREAHEKGSPVMRPYFYHYPNDSMCWNISDSYLFGADVLVAPVLEAGTVTREVYLPKGDNWIEVSTQKIWTGGQWIEANAPIDVIPVFVREGAEVEGLNA